MRNDIPFVAMRFLLIALIIATLAFIFTNSILPPSISSEESEAVSGFISKIFPQDTPLGSFVIRNIRKIAHFLEFALLGAEIALYVSFFMKKARTTAPISYAFGFFAAFIDETVQIFSARGPMIEDVWIDVFGFCVASTFVFVTVLLVKKKKASKEKYNG